MSERHQIRRWIFLDGGNLRIKESVEHPGRGWADLNALLERVEELEMENGRLRDDRERLIGMVEFLQTRT